jgi:hypothetical protein
MKPNDLEKLLLKLKIDEELENMPTRTHGRLGCYNKGRCRGPLCKEARREAMEQRRGSPTPEAEAGSPRAYLLQRLEEHLASREENLTHQRRGA